MIDFIYGGKAATHPVFGMTDVICAVGAWAIVLGLSPLVTAFV